MKNTTYRKQTVRSREEVGRGETRLGLSDLKNWMQLPVVCKRHFPVFLLTPGILEIDDLTTISHFPLSYVSIMYVFPCTDSTLFRDKCFRPVSSNW